ncbi:hypothetical protein HNQ91_001097 [Filimonas zeae]|uniref:Uncharacterized protein n=1 Tax=Filimonas zeae TaxID=1737353 RepID=A0A917ISV8_9BACT|nr:hypothetical protein [Filimonas zeae]MDR6338075.1 hypothetical protein [Filimonas zeae]GGH61587.1 hypothetical protein GCM10011379_10720 [Filimonas zeae]
MKTCILLSALAITGLTTQAQSISGSNAGGQSACSVEVSGPVNYANLLGSAELKFFVQPALSAGVANHYLYEWIFTYNDFSVSSSNDREPSLSVPCGTRIKRAYVKISAAPGCFKEFSYVYPDAGICGTEGQLKIADFPVTPDTATTLNPDTAKCTSKTQNLKNRN